MYCIKIPIYPSYSLFFTSITRTQYICTISHPRIYRIFPTPVYRVQLCHPYSSHVNFNHFRIFFLLLFGAFFLTHPIGHTASISHTWHILLYLCSVLFRFFWKCVYMLNMVYFESPKLVCGVGIKLGREDMSRINKSGTFFLVPRLYEHNTLSIYIFKNIYLVHAVYE